MRSGLLAASRFGTFYEDPKEPQVKTIQLHQVQELTICKLTLNRDRLYLLDSAGRLSCLNLSNKSVSTLTTCKLQNFHPDSWSSLSLTAVNSASQLLHIHFQRKQVCKVFNPCLNSLVAFQKNYLTESVLLTESKNMVLVDGSKRIKSVKSDSNDLFAGACLLGVNRFVCLLLRSGQIRIFDSSTLRLHSRFNLPCCIPEVKLTASNCGKTIAIYGKSQWLIVLSLNGEGDILNCKEAELPFQSILHLQFTYSERLLLLGSDRVLYGMHYEGQTGSLRPFFNQHQKYIPTMFDISIDQKLIVLIAGKTIHLMELKNGLTKVINQAQGVTVDFSEQQVEAQKQLEIRRIQYDDQQSEYSEKPKGILKQEEQFREDEPPLHSILKGRGGERSQEQGQDLSSLLKQQERIKEALNEVRGKSG